MNRLVLIIVKVNCFVVNKWSAKLQNKGKENFYGGGNPLNWRSSVTRWKVLIFSYMTVAQNKIIEHTDIGKSDKAILYIESLEIYDI
jgi:hypothetical protein